ncbi:MAG: galactokinase [Acidobacteria bacterium]|nr:galactokinase [Acidobacteriota bacterium]
MAGQASLVSELFEKQFGARPEAIERGPGRVNLIGEHTDYTLGFVLPIAIDLATFAAWRRTSSGLLRVFSTSFGQQRQWPVGGFTSLEPAREWSDYIAGVARELERAGYPVPSMDLLIHSTVPNGAGLSSSAALEVSTALALLAGRAMDPVALARLARAAENNFVGMPCGIMDQFVCVFGREKAAIRIDCRSLEHQVVRLPENVAIFAVNTMVKHELGQSAYRDRVRECAEALAVLRNRHPEVECLRDATPEMVEECRSAMPGAVYRRARHATTENRRVLDFVEASARGDVHQMGRLLFASHESLARDYEVSCEELDFLVDAARAIDGVHGARMTGGGFGGCTVNLVDPDCADAARTELRARYQRKYGREPNFHDCRPAQGAGEIWRDDSNAGTTI